LDEIYEFEHELWIVDETAPLVQIEETMPYEDVNDQFAELYLTPVQEERLLKRIKADRKREDNSDRRPMCEHPVCTKRIPKRGGRRGQRQHFCSTQCADAYRQILARQRSS
jgi:hypothetical protein